MSKKQLYFIIVGLCVVLIIMLFVPTDDPENSQTTEETSVDIQVTINEVLTVVGDAKVLNEIPGDEEVESVILEGEFVGLLDGVDAYQKKFKYMLLNDGEEVLRIDLRPLVGYSDINIIEKLGVHRGDVVVVSGVMNAGEFKVESIEQSY